MKMIPVIASVWATIEQDPKAWATSVTVGKLVTALKRASAAYYNTGESELTDAAFDTLLAVLQKRDPQNPFLAQIGSPDPKAKVALPFLLPSLDKYKTGTEIDKFVGRYAKKANSYVVADKLDGISLAITYSGGKVRLLTRGDGRKGRDVSHLAKYLALPAVSRKVAIRAELLLPKAAFNKWVNKATDPSKFNLRNFAAGLVNRTGSEANELRSAHVVAYEVIEPRMIPSKQLAWLKSAGFLLPTYRVVKSLPVASLSEYLKKRKAASKYDIDGLVVTADYSYTRTVSGNPDYAFAFKQTLEEDIAEATVVSVTYQTSKHGFLKPVVEISPIRLAGVTIRRVTAHNAKMVWDNRIGPGAIIRITRSGDVIPFIVSVAKPARKAQMPDSDWEWNATGVDAVLVDSDQNADVAVMRLAHFFATLGVENLGVGILNRLYDAGLDDVFKIVSATPARLLKIDGIQQRMATKLVQNIANGLKKTTLPQLMDASGVFGRGLGQTRLSAITDKHRNLMNEKLVKADLYALALDTPGFSTKMAQQFAQGFPLFKRFYQKLGVDVAVKRVVRTKSQRLASTVVCMTGFRDKALAELIVTHGGSVRDTFSKDVTLLLVKAKGSGSSKERIAQQRGVQIMTPAEFLKKFNLSL